ALLLALRFAIGEELDLDILPVDLDGDLVAFPLFFAGGYLDEFLDLLHFGVRILRGDRIGNRLGQILGGDLLLPAGDRAGLGDVDIDRAGPVFQRDLIGRLLVFGFLHGRRDFRHWESLLV